MMCTHYNQTHYIDKSMLTPELSRMSFHTVELHLLSLEPIGLNLIQQDITPVNKERSTEHLWDELKH